MRLMLTAFFVLAVASNAHARDCNPADAEGQEIRGLRAFSECVIAEINDLKRENIELRREIEEIRKSLTSFPGDFENKNGRVTRLGGERLTQASFSLSSRSREGASGLDIDQKALALICEIGCSITLSLTAQGLRETDTAPVVAVGPCAFRYNLQSGVWALSGACGEPVSGIDGDGAPNDNSGGEVIATAGGACILADSEPSRSVDPETGKLSGDRAKGLFLVAEPALWKGKENRFRCDLKIAR
jgi:hypothetical protein